MSGQPLSPVAALFDAVAPVYETVGPPFFDHFGALLVEHAGVRRDDRVLDLAAGSGAVAVSALAAAGHSGSLLAVDVAPGMVDRLAACLTATGHPAARAELGDAAGLEVESGSFDVALCGFALFFLPEPVSALRAWRQAVRLGGTVAVSTWGREDTVFGALRDALVDLGVESRQRGEAFDDPAVLAGALSAAGLAEVAVSTVALDLRLPDVDALLQWTGTHGGRAWLAQLDEQGRARLARRLRERWPGEVVMTWQAHLAAGTR